MTAASNQAQVAYGNGLIGQLWAHAQEKRDRDHAPMTEAALKLAAPQPGESVLDIGCGSGTTTLNLAELVTDAGKVMGIDISAPMLAVARRRARELDTHVRYIKAAAADHHFEPHNFDLVFSQFGVMFFADPVAAFVNIHGALKPGGRLAFVCWRASTDNPWAAVPESAAKPLLPPMEPLPPDAPGRYAFANPDRVKSILLRAGFHAPHLTKFDAQIHLGNTPEAAASSSIDAGPLARTLADVDAATRKQVRAAVTERLAREMTPEGIHLRAACWLVSAKV